VSRPVPTPVVHRWPWLRSVARPLWPSWLAITLGRHVFTWRPLSPAELAHEACHVRQWSRYGLRFIPRYVRASWRAWLANRDVYRDNRFEREAQAAAELVLRSPEAAAAAGSLTPGASARRW
jgi:hypothetical protein